MGGAATRGLGRIRAGSQKPRGQSVTQREPAGREWCVQNKLDTTNRHRISMTE